MTNLQLRALVAFIYFPLLLLSAYDTTIFAVVVGVIAAASWHEYLSFKIKPETGVDWFFRALCILFGISPFLGFLMFRNAGLGWAAAVLILQIMIIQCFFQRLEFTELMKRVGYWVFGLFYITGLCYAWFSVQSISLSAFPVWFLLFAVGAADTSAYFAGKKFGRRPFFQNYSPSKTWEGFWGGVIGAVAASALFWAVFMWLDLLRPNLFVCLLLGALIAVFSSFGDLFESMLKRQYKVKDSGNLLPGHGGVLDRFDGVIFGSVPLLVFVSLRSGFF